MSFSRLQQKIRVTQVVTRILLLFVFLQDQLALLWPMIGFLIGLLIVFTMHQYVFDWPF